MTLESPPASPVIPIGLGTKLGISTATVAALIAAVLAFVNGDHSPEIIALIATTAVSVVTTVGGRMAQAAALNLSQGADDDLTGDEPPPEAAAVPVERQPDPAVIPADEGDGEQVQASLRRATEFKRRG